MELNTISQTQYADLFGMDSSQAAGKQGGFGMEETVPDIFTPVETDHLKEVLGITETKDKDKVPETTIPTPGEAEKDKDKDKEEKKDGEIEADIFQQNQEAEKAKAGRKPKYDFSDISGYFQDRVKNGKFVAVEEENDKGEKILFVPKTPEEFDEVIDIQVNHRIDLQKKDIDKSWYQSKSPAWKAVARYSELVDDPSEVIPFMQGIRTLQDVSKINETEIEGAEAVVRIRLEQKGDTQEIIDEQVEALKTTDKLISTAKILKPILLNEQTQQLQRMESDEQRKQQEWLQDMSEVKDAAIKAIESPLFGKNKLKRDEQAAIYQLIAMPSPETKGFAIYDEIDKLFATRNMEKLTKIALLLAKEDSLLEYISAGASQKTSEGLQKKLRVITESRSTSGNDDPENETRTIVQRNQYTSGATRFGR